MHIRGFLSYLLGMEAHLSNHSIIYHHCKTNKNILWGKSLTKSTVVLTYLFFVLNEDLLVCLQGRPMYIGFEFCDGELKMGSDVPKPLKIIVGIGMDCNSS